ncbi:VOC family protein [Micromonospora sp. GCM10011542]|uniref:VOC family protein n=1 Tax=Micromonospora sp. GCM10011542 TaxID=3317337 RepID=UPI00360AE16C
MQLRGMATVSFWAADLDAAKNWYADLLGVEPYFVVRDGEGRPAYYEFRLGDYQHELGLIDRRYAGDVPEAPGGSILYWHVDDLAAAVRELLAAGAREHQPITERGSGTGFVTASVIDPFGNILGVMSNPHYLDILPESRRPS